MLLNKNFSSILQSLSNRLKHNSFIKNNTYLRLSIFLLCISQTFFLKFGYEFLFFRQLLISLHYSKNYVWWMMFLQQDLLVSWSPAMGAPLQWQDIFHYLPPLLRSTSSPNSRCFQRNEWRPFFPAAHPGTTSTNCCEDISGQRWQKITKLSLEEKPAFHTTAHKFSPRMSPGKHPEMQNRARKKKRDRDVWVNELMSHTSFASWFDLFTRWW